MIQKSTSRFIMKTMKTMKFLIIALSHLCTLLSFEEFQGQSSVNFEIYMYFLQSLGSVLGRIIDNDVFKNNCTGYYILQEGHSINFCIFQSMKTVKLSCFS